MAMPAQVLLAMNECMSGPFGVLGELKSSVMEGCMSDAVHTNISKVLQDVRGIVAVLRLCSELVCARKAA
jgi:hypothetical protein